MASPINSVARKRVLVVDDDEAILNLVATRLEIAGYEVHKARDGFAGFRRIVDVRPAAIVLDLNMADERWFRRARSTVARLLERAGSCPCLVRAEWRR